MPDFDMMRSIGGEFIQEILDFYWHTGTRSGTVENHPLNAEASIRRLVGGPVGKLLQSDPPALSLGAS